MRISTYIILSIIPLQFIFLNYSYLQLHCENITVYNRMYIIDSIASSVLGLIMLYLGLNILGVLAGKILGLFFAIIYSAVKFSKIGPVKIKINFSLILEMAKYSFHFYVSGIISHLHIYITNLITALYLIPSQVAFFSMAKGRCEMLTRLVPNSISALLFPRVSKSVDMNESRVITARAFRISLILLIFTGIIFAFTIKPIVYILYGKEYLPLTIPFWIILPGLILSKSTTVFSSYFSGSGRPDLMPKIAVFPMLIQGLMAYSLIPLMGIMGASVAFLISSIILGIIQLLVFLNISKSSFKDIIFKKADIYIVKEFLRKQFDIILKLFNNNNNEIKLEN